MPGVIVKYESIIWWSAVICWLSHSGMDGCSAAACASCAGSMGVLEVLGASDEVLPLVAAALAKRAAPTRNTPSAASDTTALPCSDPALSAFQDAGASQQQQQQQHDDAQALAPATVRHAESMPQACAPSVANDDAKPLLPAGSHAKGRPEDDAIRDPQTSTSALQADIAGPSDLVPGAAAGSQMDRSCITMAGTDQTVPSPDADRQQHGSDKDDMSGPAGLSLRPLETMGLV